MKKLFVFILLGAVLTLGVFSCELSKEKPCNICKPAKPDAQKLYSLSKKEIKANVYFGGNSEQPDPGYTYSVPQQIYQESDLSIIASEFIQESQLPERIAFLTIIHDTSQIITEKSISGILIYYLNDGDLFLKPFEKDANGDFVNFQNYDCKSNLVSSNEHWAFQAYLQERLNQGSYDIIMLPTQSWKGSSINQMLFAKYLEEIIQSSSFKKGPNRGGTGGESYCTSPCLRNDPYDYCMWSHEVGEWICTEQPICGYIIVAEEVVDNGEQFNGDTALLYAMKFNFFDESDSGRVWISEYYDVISEVMDSTGISMSLAMDAMDLGKNTLYPLFEDLLADSLSTDTLYGVTETIEIVNFINDFRAIAPSHSEFNAILDRVEYKVNLYEGKQIQYIWSDTHDD